MTDRRRVLQAGLGLTRAALAPARQKWAKAGAAYQGAPKEAQDLRPMHALPSAARMRVVEGEISRATARG